MGTIDQSLLSVLQTKHWFVRLFGLADKVVIFDEVHAYDAYMITILERLLHWLAEVDCTVILLSATLPEARRKTLAKAYSGRDDAEYKRYPRITLARPRHYLNPNIDGPPLCVEIPMEEPRSVGACFAKTDLPALTATLSERLQHGGCAAVICNTVDRSIEVYRHLRDSLKNTETLLFHARTLRMWRREREEEVLRKFGKGKKQADGTCANPHRPARAVLVATQVIEQSLDLDFDLMVSEIAPIDLLLQRCGRLHRHPRKRPQGLETPQFIVLCNAEMSGPPPESFGKTEHVYDRYILLCTWLTIRNWHQLQVPAEIEALVEAVYGDPAPDGGDAWNAALTEAKARTEHDRNESEKAAGTLLVCRPKDPSDLIEEFNDQLADDEDPQVHKTVRAATREGDPSIMVVMLPTDTVLTDDPGVSEVRALLDRSVKLSHRGVFRSLLDHGESPKEWKRNAHLRHARLLRLDAKNQGTIGDYALAVNEGLGVVIKQVVGPMTEFNLIDQPWIPCIDSHGERVEYGIRDTLLKAHALREICDDSPLVTVALHRLLLAILYRAHNGPGDFKAWKDLYTRGAFNDEMVKTYLDKWSNRFDLISNSHPFFQMAQLETKRPVSVTRLATECASGNNATLFDHRGDEEEGQWLPAQAAKSLIACQSFALGFGKSGNAKINGEDEALPYSSDAIALRGMNIWLQGKTLFDTLMINLTPTDDASSPPWELDDPHQHRDRLHGKAKRAVASFGTLDRLTWQSRLVRLLPDNGSFSRMCFTQGRSADKSAGDPMKVYRASKEEGISPVPLSSGKAAWRDAHSILTIPAPTGNERRPECFNLVARAHTTGLIQPETQFVAHVVGLASAPNKAGKFLLWRHDRMPVPAAMLADINLIERLGGLLQNAEQAASELNLRTRRMARLYLAPHADEPDGRKPDENDVAKLTDKIDPRPTYWARLERHFFVLLESLPGDWDNLGDDWKPVEQQTATDAWREHVKDEARRALEESIRSLGTTSRAIQAVARVRTEFSDYDLSPPQRKAAKTKRSAKGSNKR